MADKEFLGKGTLDDPFQTKIMWSKTNPMTQQKEYYIAQGGGSGGGGNTPADQIEFITDEAQADGNLKKIYILS